MRPAISVKFMALVSALALAGAACSSRGQEPSQDGLQNSDPVENSQYLGTVYKDEKNGFRLTPPAGSRIVQRVGVDLVSFVVDRKSWGGSLQRVTLEDKPLTFEELLANNKVELEKSFKAVDIQQTHMIDFHGKPAMLLNISLQAALGAAADGGLSQESHSMDKKAANPQHPKGGPADDVLVGLLRQQLIIQAQKDDKTGKGLQYYFLTLYSPLKDRDAATHTFQAMLPELEIFDAKDLYARRVQSAKAGRDWLDAHPAEEFVKKLSGTPQYFLLQVDSKNVGFIQLSETSRMRGPGSSEVDAARDGRKGVIMTVKFASFADAAINYGLIDEFWSFTHDSAGQQLGQYSEWSILTKSLIKDPLPPGSVAPGGMPYRILTPWRQESGTITQDSPKQRPRVLVTYGGDSKENLPADINTIMPEGNTAALLPKVLEYTWPRLVDVTKPSEMSFTTYDSRNNKLALRNLIVTGRQETIKVNGKSTPAYKLIDEIDPNNTTLWVNKDGQIQLMKTSDQSVLQPTTFDTVNRLWPDRPSQ